MNHQSGNMGPGAASVAADLFDYWRLIKRHRYQILLLTLSFTVLAALTVFQMTPIYRGTAMLLIENIKSRVMTLNDIYSGQRDAMEAFNSQVQILRSRSVAERVIRKLNLAEHPAMAVRGNQKLGEAERMELLVNRVTGGLTIEPVLRSQIVHVSFDSPDRELAASVANAVVDAYIDGDLESRSEMTQKANGWLLGRIEATRKRLEESQQALQRYREKENIIDNKGIVLSGTGRQFEEVSTHLTSARMRFAEAESAYTQVKGRKGEPTERLESIPAVLKDSTVRQMKGVETEALAKVNEYKNRYAPAHPKMIAAEADLKSARESLARAIDAVIDGIYREYELARANVNAAASAKAQTQSEIQSISRKESQLSVLQHEVESNRQLYDNLVNRAKETETTANLQSTAGRLIDPAVPPLGPIKPQKAKIIGAAALFGLFVSVLLVLARDYLDNTIRSEQDVEHRLRTGVLGVVPFLGKNEGGSNPSAVFQDQPDSVFAESIRGLRTSVLLSAIDEPHRVVVVTSTLPGEGKTTIAINLAQALGQLKRVLLVDADMRRPTVAKKLGGGVDGGAGLVEYLAGEAPMQDCIRTTANPNVFVLPAGKRLNSPLELISSQRFADTVKELKQRFDVVVVDCPPIKPVSDSLVISRFANAVLYVVKTDGAPHQLIGEAIASLRDVEAPLLGVVLNQMNMQKAQGYGSYSYQYKYAYGKEPAKPPRTFLGIRI